MFEAQISGVKEAFAELLDNDVTDPVVKATIVLSESGFATVESAFAFGDIKETFAGTSYSSVPLYTLLTHDESYR